jgi:hypothetical protein
LISAVFANENMANKLRRIMRHVRQSTEFDTPTRFFRRVAASFNHTVQPTAGLRTASLHFMKTLPLQAALALTSGG